MRIKLVFILFLFLQLNCYSQSNFVNNYSFESYDTCQTVSSTQINNAKYWFSANSASPDYYNACSQDLGVPICNPGAECFQYAKNGVAYTGIWCYDKGSTNLREYIETKLIDSLVANQCYYIEFYVNLINWANRGVNGIGCKLTKDSLYQNNYYNINLSPTINMTRVISDTLDWIRVAGVYKANGGEFFITIGNFLADNQLEIDSVSNAIISGAYYLIDDVRIASVDSLDITAFAGNDTTILQGDSLFIGQEISNLNCNWYILGGTQIASNISGIYVKPSVTTSYVVQQNLCGTITYDTIYVTVIPNGIKEKEKGDLSFEIYPNPSNGKFMLRHTVYNVQSTDITVQNIPGETVYTCKSSSNNLELDLSGLANGTYFVTVRDIHNKQVTKRLIINK